MNDDCSKKLDRLLSKEIFFVNGKNGKFFGRAIRLVKFAPDVPLASGTSRR